jgi:hypothetical protein
MHCIDLRKDLKFSNSDSLDSAFANSDEIATAGWILIFGYPRVPIETLLKTSSLYLSISDSGRVVSCTMYSKNETLLFNSSPHFLTVMQTNCLGFEDDIYKKKI